MCKPQLHFYVTDCIANCKTCTDGTIASCTECNDGYLSDGSACVGKMTSK